MNKLLIVFLHLTLFVNITAWAQYDQQAAKEIIQKSVKKYKAFSSLKVKFISIIEDRMNETKEKQAGIFYLKNGNFKVVLGDQIIISDQIKIWTYFKGENEVQINNYNPEDLEINPNTLFTIWEKGFLYGYAGETEHNNKLVNLIELTPEDKDLPYYKVKLFIDKSSFEIVKMQTFYKNSQIILTFEIESITPNVELPETFFKFYPSKYSGIQVVDLSE